MSIVVKTFGTAGPADTAGLREALHDLPRERVRRLAVFGKTEGPATLNDTSRDLAIVATDAALDASGFSSTDAWQIFSTGCEGIASPTTAMIAELDDGGTDRSRRGLVFGAARSAPLPAHDRCGRTHIAAAAATVREALAQAGLSAQDVALLLVKSPVLSGNQAHRAGPLARHAGSTGSSRGAAALGAAVALEQASLSELGDDPVGRTAVHAEHTMVFSGTETDCLEVLALGEAIGGDPRWRLQSHRLSDMLDVDPLLRARAPSLPALVFFKAGIPADGHLRGRRTTVLTSDLPADKQLRAAASGIVAACFGNAPTFISAGSEHQGAPGSCLCVTLTAAG